MLKFHKLLLSVFFTILLSVQAFAIGADDFLPPAQADNESQKQELSTVKDDSAVRTEQDKNLGVEVVRAPTLQDAINKIIEKPRRGCRLIRRDEGLTFVATGTGKYNPSHKNVLASRIEQRDAYVEAFMTAKAEMAQSAGQLVIRGATSFERIAETLTNETRTLTNIERQLSEEQLLIVRKVLKGYVTYSVLDDEKGGVYVTLVSSPKTRGKFTRFGDNGVTAENLRDGLNSVISEIKNNLVPPVGGRIIDVPETGEVAWVGFGSFIVRKDDEPDVQAELDLQAEQMAGLRAVDALAGIILGDDTLFGTHGDEQTSKQVKDFERLQQSDQTGKGTESELREYNQRIKTMRNAVRSGSKVQSLRRGVLPPGIMRYTELDDDGYFAYGIAVYIPSVSEMANEASQEMDDAQIVQPLNNNRNGQNSSSGYPFAGNSNGQRNNNTNLKMKKGPSGVINQGL